MKNILVAVVVLISGLILSACDGTNVGGNSSGPIADAGPNQTVRSGQKVLLSSTNSDDPDGVILDHTWTQIATGAPQVELYDALRFPADPSVSTPVVSFFVPEVYSATDFVFRVTVTDDGGKTDSADVTITAKPPIDSNQLLKFDSVPATFKVVAATDSSGEQGNFDIIVTPSIDYFDASGASGTLSGADLAGGLAEQTRLGQSWSDAGSGGQSTTDYRNPRYTFDIPVVRLEDINSAIDNNPPIVSDPNDPPEDQYRARVAQRIDESKAYQANSNESVDVTVTISLDGPSNPYIYVLGEKNELIADGTPPLSINLEDLQVQGTDPFPEQENQTTADVYYDAIICPADADLKDTFTGWLEAVDYYGDINEVTETSYINGFDLGFGRKMSVSVNNDTGEVFSWVNNHVNLELAELNVNPLVNVVMEFSPPPCVDATSVVGSDGKTVCTNCYTKYFTYVRDRNDPDGEQSLVTSFDFDGRGEKFQPGSCALCHGGRPKALVGGVYPDPEPADPFIDAGDIATRFLPWDQATLFFSDDDFLKKLPYDQRTKPTPEQETAIRKFNEAVLRTLTDDTSEAEAAMREVIHGWYGSTTSDNSNTLDNNPFNHNFVPAGWIGNEALYLDVIGPTCRACHNQRDDLNNVKTFQQFSDSDLSIARTVYDESTMPLARLTVDNFWIDGNGRADNLASALDTLGIDVSARRPGTPKAIASDISGIFTGDSVRLDGTRSLFTTAGSDPYVWSCTTPGGSSCTDQLVGATTGEPAFLATEAGDYTIDLQVQNANGQTDALDNPLVITVGSGAPYADTSITQSFNVATGGLRSLKNFLRYKDNNNGDSEIVYTVTSGPAFGSLTRPTQFTQQDIEDDLVSYQHDAASDPSNTSDQFSFTVSDGFHAPVAGVFAITISQDLQVTVSPLIVLLNSSAPLQGALTTVDPNDLVADIQYTVTASPAHGALSQNSFLQSELDSGAVTYLHTDAVADISDQFSFTATNAGKNKVGTFTITLNPSFSQNIQPLFQNNTITDYCAGCHAEFAGSSNALYTAVTSRTQGGSNNNYTCNSSPHSILCKPSLTPPLTHGSFTLPVAGYDVNNLDNGDRSSYDLLLRWINAGRIEN